MSKISRDSLAEFETHYHHSNESKVWPFRTDLVSRKPFAIHDSTSGIENILPARIEILTVWSQLNVQQSPLHIFNE